MIIWRGWGILVILITGLFFGVSAYLMNEILHISGIITQGIYFISYVISGILIWLIGKRLNRDLETTHHSLFFVRMEYWGFLIPTFGFINFILSFLVIF